MHERQVAETGRYPAGGEILVGVLWREDDVRRRGAGRTEWGMELSERDRGGRGVIAGEIEREAVSEKMSFRYSGDACGLHR
jgi:hypothetical protein